MICFGCEFHCFRRHPRAVRKWQPENLRNLSIHPPAHPSVAWRFAARVLVRSSFLLVCPTKDVVYLCCLLQTLRSSIDSYSDSSYPSPPVPGPLLPVPRRHPRVASSTTTPTTTEIPSMSRHVFGISMYDDDGILRGKLPRAKNFRFDDW